VQDVSPLLDSFPNLFPSIQVYTHNDGSSSRLLCFNGTLPVTYRGLTYNIPIELWLPEMYPNGAPIMFVRPTQDMLINPSNEVDPNGRVYHSVLHSWNFQSSNLVQLLFALQNVFALHPPVYAKPPLPPTPPAISPKPVQPQGTPAYEPTVYPPVNRSSYDGAQGGMNSKSNPPKNWLQDMSTDSTNSSMNLPPPLDPHVMKLNSLKLEVSSLIQTEFQPWSKEIKEEMERLLQDSKALFDEQNRLYENELITQSLESEAKSHLDILQNSTGLLKRLVETWEAKEPAAPDDILTVSDENHKLYGRRAEFKTTIPRLILGSIRVVEWCPIASCLQISNQIYIECIS
jgi:ESCRT-I complex subunit TSG101